MSGLAAFLASSDTLVSLSRGLTGCVMCERECSFIMVEVPAHTVAFVLHECLSFHEKHPEACHDFMDGRPRFLDSGVFSWMSFMRRRDARALRDHLAGYRHGLEVLGNCPSQMILVNASLACLNEALTRA